MRKINGTDDEGEGSLTNATVQSLWILQALSEMAFSTHKSQTFAIVILRYCAITRLETQTNAHEQQGGKQEQTDYYQSVCECIINRNFMYCFRLQPVSSIYLIFLCAFPLLLAIRFECDCYAIFDAFYFQSINLAEKKYNLGSVSALQRELR